MIELDDKNTPNDRIIELVRILFRGKQREAARTFGISQAALSKIMRNEQVVGQRVLAAIAAHPRVNSFWLYTGEGKPMVPDGEGGSSSSALDLSMSENGPTLPVSDQLLPGPPGDFLLLLTRKRMAVANSDYALSRYLLEINSDFSILHAKEEKVASGDCLLMETNQHMWINYAGVLNRKLMVVRIGTGIVPELVLARGGCQPEGEFLPLDLFGETRRIVKLALKVPVSDLPVTTLGRQGRAIELEDKHLCPDVAQTGNSSLPQSPSVEATSKTGPLFGTVESRSSKKFRETSDIIVQLKDVVSISVLLIRS